MKISADHKASGVVTDIYLEQIEVDKQWFHAERIFGRPASTFKVGDVVEGLNGKSKTTAHAPDEYVDSCLFRESGANVSHTAETIIQFAEAMEAYGGWGEFPPIAARIVTITKEDVDRYEEFEKAGCASELAYSRPLSVADIGRRIAHIENGHNRAYAAARCGIAIAVYDLLLQDKANEVSCSGSQHKNGLDVVSCPGLDTFAHADAKTLRHILDWIDSVPSDWPLPTMPGFDRDWIESLISGQMEGWPNFSFEDAIEMALEWVDAVPPELRVQLTPFQRPEKTIMKLLTKNQTIAGTQLDNAKSEVIEREGHIVLVLADPSVAPWKRNRVAEMTEDEGTGCWMLVDIRLKRFPQLSVYGCSTGADAYHASFAPENDGEAKMIKSMLREYREDADGSIHWCSFDGIVRGHPEVDGYRPIRYLNFNQSGGFSREEGMEKLLEMKAFWDVHDGSLANARIDNPHRQLSQSEVEGLIIGERMNAERDRRIVALGMLEKKAGAEYTLWQRAAKALAKAGGNAAVVNWEDVEKDVIAESILKNKQQRESVIEALMAHSPLRNNHAFQFESINKVIDAVQTEGRKESMCDVQQVLGAADDTPSCGI